MADAKSDMSVKAVVLLVLGALAFGQGVSASTTGSVDRPHKSLMGSISDPDMVSCEAANGCWTPLRIGLGGRAALPWCVCNVYGADVGVLAATYRLAGAQCAVLWGEACELYGFQVAGLVGESKDAYGFQVAGWCVEAADVFGCQFGGLFSRARDVAGAQVGGTVAYSESLSGLGVGGLGNMTSRLYGCQVGLFNFAESGGGLQIGLMNSALRGGILQIGLVNYCRDATCWLLPIANFAW